MENNGRADGQASFALHHDAWGRLVLTEGGRAHVGVVPVRAFPLSDPRHGVAVCDGQGRELVWIDDLETVPEPARGRLKEELARREFVPIVKRIVKVSAAVEPSEWEVETDRGRTRFLLNSDSDVHRFDEHRALLTDANGVRYLIPDTRALDAGSRALLERY
jgi:hypothetical protein